MKISWSVTVKMGLILCQCFCDKNQILCMGIYYFEFPLSLLVSICFVSKCSVLQFVTINCLIKFVLSIWNSLMWASSPQSSPVFKWQLNLSFRKGADPRRAREHPPHDMMLYFWLGLLALVWAWTKVIFLCNWFLIVEFFINFSILTVFFCKPVWKKILVTLCSLC